MPKFKRLACKEDPGLWIFFCPGCGHGHHVRTLPCPNRQGDPVWSWNDDPENPTVTPSLLLKEWDGKKEVTSCHLFITDGQIKYLGDCAHELKGQTIPIPDWDAT